MAKDKRYVVLDRIVEGRIRGTEYAEQQVGKIEFATLRVMHLPTGESLVKFKNSNRVTVIENGHAARDLKLVVEGVGEDPPMLILYEDDE